MACTDNSTPRRSLPYASVGAVATTILTETKTFYALTISDNVYDLNELTGPEFVHLGPAIEDIVVHVEATDMSASFRYNIGIQHRFTSGAWSTPVKLFSTDNTSTGYNISPIFNNRGEFGVQTRLVLMTNVVTSGAAGESADLSIAVAVRFFN
ncbi:MAG: hypothetical protein ACI9MC_003150 [Kiritimatiellia bacterium]|jgi:hypothetical protein